MGAALGPSHLLSLDKSLTQDLVDGRLNKGRGNGFSMPITVTVIGNKCSVGANVGPEFSNDLQQLPLLLAVVFDVQSDLPSFRTEMMASPIRFPFFVEIDRDDGVVVFSSGIERKLALLDMYTDEWIGVYPNDGTELLSPRLSRLNLWMTDPENDRITAILPGGVAGIAADWGRNMVTKFM
jgi:hypothetical protein